MLAACSDKDFAPDANGPGNNGNATGKAGYLAVEIKLPQEVRSTRAGSNENDQFDDGTENEYAVDNGLIIVFAGSEEKTAKFHAIQDLTKPFFTNAPGNDNITSSYIAAVPVKDIGNNEKYWGLVILNRSSTDAITVEKEGEGESVKEFITIAGKKFYTDQTFSDFLKLEADGTFKFLVEEGTGDQKKYSKFMMTNAPMSEKPGETTDPTAAPGIRHLADLGNTTYETIDEAKKNVKNCIYVERAVAKVTCTQSANAFKLNFYSGDATVEDNKIDPSKLKISATVKYALTHTNKRSYIVRNVDFGEGDHFAWNLKSDLISSTLYRMVGGVAMPPLNDPYHGTDVEKPSLYRTYWCKDPNYSTAITPDDKKIIDKDDAAEFVSIDKPLYCKENTFTVKYQNYANTTMAIFEVDYNITYEKSENNIEPINNLYIKDGDHTKIYISLDAATSDGISRILNDEKIQKAVAKAYKESGNEGTLTDIRQYLEIVRKANEKKVIVYESISLKKTDGVFDDKGVAKFNELIADYKNELLGKLNAQSEVIEYTNGISYHYIPIEHFGNTYTKLPDNWSGTKTEDVYNGGAPWTNPNTEHAGRYLGRYGMVRNNWYELNINKFTGLGDATIPNVDVETSDDNKEKKQYIGVEIHTLSWARRYQGIDF